MMISDKDENAKHLAEEIHSKLCHSNHTDGCGWFLDSWDTKNGSRTSYLEQARKMIDAVGFEYAMVVINCL